MEVITEDDLKLINELSEREYSGNTLLSNASDNEKQKLKNIKIKLKAIAEYYSSIYGDSYGQFETSVSTGNDIAIGGKSLKRIWSGIFKGAINKQYAAQISFVMNPNEACLNVGFYFGSASGHSKSLEERQVLGDQLQGLGNNLSETIVRDRLFRERYEYLFFKAYINRDEVRSAEWVEEISERATSSRIVAKIFPNKFGVIEHSTVDSYVAQVMFLMGGVSAEQNSARVAIKPLTPEQLAKQAERRAEIGLNGELFVMNKEKELQLSYGRTDNDYPKHVALESTHYGYDILSLDEDGEEIYIEVKTTTRSKQDSSSRVFYMSTNEYSVFSKNADKYKLYRVYDIDNSPEKDILNLNSVTRKPDGYICSY